MPQSVMGDRRCARRSRMSQCFTRYQQQKISYTISLPDTAIACRLHTMLCVDRRRDYLVKMSDIDLTFAGRHPLTTDLICGWRMIDLIIGTPLDTF